MGNAVLLTSSSSSSSLSSSLPLKSSFLPLELKQQKEQKELKEQRKEEQQQEEEKNKQKFLSSSLFFSSSSSSNYLSEKNNNLLLNEVISNEIKIIRQQLKEHSLIHFDFKYVFILFSPPEYTTRNIAEYISKTIHLPVIYPYEYIVDINNSHHNHHNQHHNNHHNQQQQQQQHNHHHNQNSEFHLYSTHENYQQKNSNFDPVFNCSPHDENYNHHNEHDQHHVSHTNHINHANHHSPHHNQNGREYMNYSTRTLLRKSSSVNETTTREKLLRRIRQDDCSRGFILYEYPDTITEMNYFKTCMVPDMRVELFFLKLDQETMKALLHKFDRWVHEPSGRSYHLVTSPPRTISDERKPSIPINMIDDITGEPLTKRHEDTVEYYKDQLYRYEIKEIPMYYEYEDNSHIINGGGSEKEIQRALLKELYELKVSEVRNRSTSSVLTLNKITI